MHIFVGKLTIIGSDNGLSPGRRQAIIRTNAGILLIGTLGTNFSEILSEIHTFSIKKMHLKMSSGKCRPFCLGFNVLRANTEIMPAASQCQYQNRLAIPNGKEVDIYHKSADNILMQKHVWWEFFILSAS